jgi:signal transduction histidine kinase
MTAAPGRLEQTAPLLAALLDEAREPIFALDENGTIVHANHAGAALLNRQRTHLVGKPFSSLVELESRRAFRAAFGRAETEHAALEAQVIGVGTTTLVLRALPDLAPRHIVITIDAAGETKAQARAQAQAQHTEVAAALERFFLRFPLGVVGVHLDRRVAFANPRARLLLGNVRAGRVFDPPAAFIDAADRILGLRSVTESVRVELDDGRAIRITGMGAFRSQPAILMFEDVTRSRREMDAMYAFIRNAAHQLRTPLTSIATAIEVLRAGAKNDPVERDRFLAHIDDHAQRLIKIARALLVLARAQSGEPLRLDVVRLEPLLTALGAETVPAPGVRVTVDCAPGLDALIDSDLMHEALAALVENAVQHTREGTIHIAAGTTNGHVSISVTDEGGGVLPEHRERIFEPFYQPVPSAGGYGLGLAIAAQAVQAMDGALTVDEAANGARFTITLPSATRAR